MIQIIRMYSNNIIPINNQDYLMIKINKKNIFNNLLAIFIILMMIYCFQRKIAKQNKLIIYNHNKINKKTSLKNIYLL